MDIDSLCMQTMRVQKFFFFTGKGLKKIVDCRECGGFLAKPICTTTVYFNNFTIPEYIEIDKSELSVPPLPSLSRPSLSLYKICACCECECT